MAKVDISINGRTFRLGCDDGEEGHLRLLADHLRRHVDNLRAGFGPIADDELYLMAGLLVCDELYDARGELLQLESDPRLDRKSVV
jgi:cell division protein ZapA